MDQIKKFNTKLSADKMDLIRKETEVLVQKGVLTELTWDQVFSQ